MWSRSSAGVTPGISNVALPCRLPSPAPRFAIPPRWTARRRSGASLDHLLELVGVEGEHIASGRGRLLERWPQPGQQRLASLVGDATGGVLERLGHRLASSNSCLIRARNFAASAP
jgi:hypothetical protein